MSIEPGSELGHYTVLSEIGRGGMGVVWKARDAKLGREVAIKTLPEQFAQDAERLARFEREARLLASLNHPHIAAIYGLEEHAETRFLVLELVEGETLAEKLRGGPIPVEESLRLAFQIAEALEAAHEKGVVHRDLKPANVKITPDGQVKVLDFGLAKALSGERAAADISESPTLSMAATRQGIILGTPAYMSPEQARSKPADRRTDIWSFGAVLFEMLTGQKTFAGEDVSMTLSRILQKDPDFDLLPSELPERVVQAVKVCLQKDPKQRGGDIAAIRLAMEGGFETAAVEVVEAGPQSKWPWVAAITLAVIVAVLAGWNLKPDSPGSPIRLTHQLSPAETFVGVDRLAIVVSPDGRQVVYNTSEGLQLLPIDEFDARPIPGTEEFANNLMFSPDGQWVGYWSRDDQQLQKVPLGGGAPVVLANVPFNPIGASWDEDNIILFGAPEGAVMSVSGDGGTPEPLFEVDAGFAILPQMLPGRESVLFTLVNGDNFQVAIKTLGVEVPKVLFSGEGARYIPTRHIVYAFDGSIYAQPFDFGSLEVTGGPVPVVDGVATAPGMPQFGVSDSGVLAYIPGGPLINIGAGPQMSVVFAGRDGITTPIGVPDGNYRNPRVSPDGTQLAIETQSDTGSFISVYEFSGETAMRRLTVEGSNSDPVWTPDGERIAYASDGGGTAGIFWRAADGSGVPERLTTAEDGTLQFPESFSPDGSWLSFRQDYDDSSNGVWLLSMENREAMEFAYTPLGVAMGSAFSPDGRWLTYASSEGTLVSADIHLYAEPFPQTGERRRIGENVGIYGVWSGDGTELIYRRSIGEDSRQSLFGIRVSTNPSFDFTTETELLSGTVVTNRDRNFDVMPDGDRIVAILPPSISELQNEINIVVNWFTELRERVPVP